MIYKIAMVVFLAAFALSGVVMSEVLWVVAEIAAGIAAIALLMNA